VIENGALDGGGGMGVIPTEAVRICSAPGRPDWEGLRLPELGHRLGVSPREAADRVVADAGPGAVVAVDIMSEEDVRTVMANPLTMIGSDGVPAGGRPHPRLYGTFPRVLGRYARDLGVVTLEDAVRKMTSLPAETFGLTDRGAIAVGRFADVVVFDADTISDTATFDDPCRFPAGIDTVLVNGTVVVDRGEGTGARPGQGLRRRAAG
jgi:N-acyl-D-aspartate/D-glutamate deacylase